VPSAVIESANIGIALEPDVKILLDVPVADGLRRASLAGNKDRFEREGTAFHERVRHRRPIDKGRKLTAIFAESLVKNFPPDVRAVDGIDFDVPEGQVFGFLGPNGSGKTTTVRMLTTLLRPTSGRASVAGLDITSDAGRIRQRIGVALQEAGLDDLQTGRELLLLQDTPSRDS
jgi:ABC-type glutathione transport system ATPase component